MSVDHRTKINYKEDRGNDDDDDIIDELNLLLLSKIKNWNVSYKCKKNT